MKYNIECINCGWSGAHTKSETEKRIVCDNCGYFEAIVVHSVVDEAIDSTMILDILKKQLEYMGDEMIFRRASDGTCFGAKEMIRLLEERDPIAMEYLRAICGAAMRIVKVEAK